MTEVSTYELLSDVIPYMDKTIRILSVVEVVEALNGEDGTYELTISDTKWATIGFNVTIKGNTYKIIDLDTNSKLTVTGPVLVEKGYFDLYVPKFYHGTINATEKDLNALVNNNLLSSDKLPMIWLHEPVEEQISLQKDEAIERNSNCELYFLIDANFSGWSNEDHYTQAIKPMRQLFSAFLEACRKAKTIDADLIVSYRLNDLARFGRYTGYDGKSKAVFSQYELSGTKVSITLPFIRRTC